MSPAKNLVSEIENTYLNRILIFEENELGIENLNFGFFMPFLHMLLGSKYVKFVDFTVLD